MVVRVGVDVEGGWFRGAVLCKVFREVGHGLQEVVEHEGEEHAGDGGVGLGEGCGAVCAGGGLGYEAGGYEGPEESFWWFLG